MDAVRALIVDDHLVVREGLRWMLGASSDVEVVGEAESADEAIRALEANRPDVVLLDIHLPGRSGLEVLREMRERFPGVPVVILSMSQDPEYVEQAVRAGASGYLVKNVSQAELVRALRAAVAGDAYIQAEVTRPLLERFAREVREPGAGPALSRREIQVISLLALGLANKQIAARLGLSEPTVKGYLRQAYEKLGAADRAQAVAVAVRHRLIE